MCVVSYVFVVRGLSHTHFIDESTMAESEAEYGGNTVTIQEGQTTRDNRHRHELRITPDGPRVEANHDHYHNPTGEQGTVEFGQAEGNLQARVPKYGKLMFWDKNGKLVDKGINVGNEWAYRSYIEGGTLATAIWTFEGLRSQDFKEGIPLEMVIRVFRTYKGEIERGIFGSIQVVQAVDSEPGMPPKPEHERNRYAKINFTAREFTADSHVIPFTAPGFEPDGTEREMHLFDDLVSDDGKLEVWIRCGEKAQYFGMAQKDVYIREADGLFWTNFAKGFMGIWFQMIIATCFAVMFSTFLNGAVAMLATVAAIFLGFVTNFVMGLFTHEVEGGGPSESLVRLFSQKDMVLELEPGVTTSMLKGFDFVATLVMAGVCSVLPDYGGFNTSSFVAHGFGIANGLVARHFLITIAYERLFERFPNLRIASIENGAEFLPDLFRKLRQSRDRLAVMHYYKEDPGLLFKEHVWINPFWEDDVYDVEACMGPDHVLFGSDWPHIEGMPQPLDYVAELSDFDDAKKQMILRDNARSLNARRPA